MNVSSSHPWVSSPEYRDDCVPERAAASLHGLLNAEGESPRSGELLPPLWHWLAFPADASQRELGFDGHPRLGGFLPPVKHSRRMLVGGRIEFVGQVEIDQSLHRTSFVTSVTEKSGRSGELTFIKISHEYSSKGHLVIKEVQDLVYRPAGSEGGSKVVDVSNKTLDQSSDANWTWHQGLLPNEALLFRFSALTYNAHRIHYDHPYATEVEGYPGLVVQGPLQAIALAEMCRRFTPGRRIETFEFRARRPAFCNSPLLFRGRLNHDGYAELKVLDVSGQTTMTASASLTHRGH